MFESIIGLFGEQGTMVEFAAPWVWFLLPLPLLVYFLASAYQTHAESVQVATLEALTTSSKLEASKGVGAKKRAYLLVSIIWLTLLSAAARPELIRITEQKEVPVRDILLVLDISGSMAIRDMQGDDGKPSGSSRMQVMQKAVGEFIEKRRYDNIGLIVFGSQALPLTPLSRDHDAVLEQIREMVPGMAGPQTSIGDAIGVAIRSYREMEQEAHGPPVDKQVEKERMMILLTDGMDTSSVLPPRVALRLAEKQKTIIHTIAFGDVRTEESNTSIDTALLRDVAAQTRGSFHEASGSLVSLMKLCILR